MNPLPLQLALENGFAWTWRTSLQATVLIALVFAVQFLFGRLLAPRWRYALGLLVLLRLALPTVPASHFSIFNLEHRLPSRSVIPAVPSVLQSAPPVLSLAAPAASASPRREHAHWPIPALVWLAGCTVMLGIVARQQRKLTLQLRGQTPLTDARLLNSLAECKAQLGIKRMITLLAVSRLNTPALFGQLRPRLLIPEEILRRLDDRELRFVLLHELTHLKRRDILVNWAVIIFRALHWFNPAVWLAFKRLRADQELACDAAVMARLAADERKFYGHTLIKLLEGFSAAPLCPGLVPFITNKQIIKRRIAMISKFKPAGRPALAGSISLLLALAGFTFTGAAGQSNEAPKPDNPTTSSSAPAASDAERQRRLEPKERLIAVLNEQLDRLSAVVRIEQDELSDLRKKLNIPNDVAEGKAVSKVDSETMHHYDDLVMDAESQYVQQEKLLSELKKLPMEELKKYDAHRRA